MPRIEITPGTYPGFVQARVYASDGTLLFGGASDPEDVYDRTSRFAEDQADLYARIKQAARESRGNRP